VILRRQVSEISSESLSRKYGATMHMLNSEVALKKG